MPVDSGESCQCGCLHSSLLSRRIRNIPVGVHFKCHTANRVISKYHSSNFLQSIIIKTHLLSIRSNSTLVLLVPKTTHFIQTFQSDRCAMCSILSFFGCGIFPRMFFHLNSKAKELLSLLIPFCANGTIASAIIAKMESVLLATRLLKRSDNLEIHPRCKLF